MVTTSKSYTITKRPPVTDGFLKLKGSYKNYVIKIDGDVLKVEDKSSEPYKSYEYTGLKDGAIRFFGFDDLKRVSVIDKKPYHVSDIVDLTEAKPLEISVDKLLENDKDFRDSKLSIFSVKNAVGCIVTLLKDGKINIIPETDFQGIRSFEYTIQNDLGFKNANEIKVYLREPHHPNDPEFFDQWYLQEMNVTPVWKDYSGNGVKVAVLDEGYIPSNPDIEVINNPYEVKYDDEALGQHGLCVTSVIGAKHNNSIGITGIAFDANITSAQLPMGHHQDSTDELAIFSDFDVINNSWGISINSKCEPQHASYPLLKSKAIDQSVQNQLEATEKAAMTGRDGKGSIIVFAGGNDIYADSNLEPTRVNPYNIVVGGYSKPYTQLTTFENAWPHFASTSAQTLVAAPASHFMIADNSELMVENDKISAKPNNEKVAGTSFASPAVAATTALMLEANPNLGWRDVQDILAYSALPKNSAEFPYTTNGARNSNGGGLQYNKEYGFGIADTFGAVRLAEVWPSSNTIKNYSNLSSTPKTYSGKMAYGQFQETFRQSEEIEIEYIKLNLNCGFDISNFKGLVLNLVLSVNIASPSAHTYNVVKNIGYNPMTKQQCIDFGSKVDWDFGLQHARGESWKGDWNVTISLSLNPESGSAISPEGQASLSQLANLGKIIPSEIGLDFYGKPKEHFSKELIYTSYFSKLDGPRQTIKAWEKIFDTINTVTIATPVTINLSANNAKIDGKEITLEKDHSIKNIKAGDGNDILIADNKNNMIMPGRGNDTMIIGGGADIVWYPSLKWSNLGHDIIHDFDIRKDKLKIGGATYTEIQALMTPKNKCSEEGVCKNQTVIGNDEWSITLVDVAISELNESHFIFC
jgi:subtilisin family serine protease